MIWAIVILISSVFQVTIVRMKYTVCDYDQIRRITCAENENKTTNVHRGNAPTAVMGIVWEFCDFSICTRFDLHHPDLFQPPGFLSFRKWRRWGISSLLFPFEHDENWSSEPDLKLQLQTWAINTSAMFKTHPKHS